jgi:hypothetical protein
MPGQHDGGVACRGRFFNFIIFNHFALWHGDLMAAVRRSVLAVAAKEKIQIFFLFSFE